MGEGGWEYQVSAIRLELNTTVFSRVPHLPHVTMMVFPSPEPICPLQRINLPSFSGVGEGQVPGYTGFNCALWNLLANLPVFQPHHGLPKCCTSNSWTFPGYFGTTVEYGQASATNHSFWRFLHLGSIGDWIVASGRQIVLCTPFRPGPCKQHQFSPVWMGGGPREQSWELCIACPGAPGICFDLLPLFFLL